MTKIKQIIKKIKLEENLTTQEVLTKSPDLAILLEQEEQQKNYNRCEHQYLKQQSLEKRKENEN
jgi:uncharacterized protein YehS (DUF1456 family)